MTYPDHVSENDQKDGTLIQKNSAPSVFDSFNDNPNQTVNNLNDQNSESNLSDSNYSSYICERSYRFHMNSRVLFSFRLGINIILYAKSRGPTSNSVYISKNPDIHIKSKQYEYILLVMNHSKKFVLKEINSEEELMIILMDNDYGVEYGPRKIEIFWPKDNLKHVSRIPKRTKKGDWTLNFGSKFVITSIKNAIILDENAKPTLIVRKVEKEKLQIEVVRKYKPIYLFAFAIASFICPF